jgi:hypothetical protein
VLVCLLGSYLLCRAIVRSPFGAVLAGIRENEPKTIALGYNTRAYKITTVVLAYGFGGLAGALYAAFAGFASPELFFWLTSGRVLIMVIVGGAGTLISPDPRRRVLRLLEHQAVAGHRPVAADFSAPFSWRVRDVRAAGNLGHFDEPFPVQTRGPEFRQRQGGTRCRYLSAGG